MKFFSLCALLMSFCCEVFTFKTTYIQSTCPAVQDKIDEIEKKLQWSVVSQFIPMLTVKPKVTNSKYSIAIN